MSVITSVRPGSSSGSEASPERKASRKLTSGSRGCSTTMTRNPEGSEDSSGSGRFNARSGSGAGGWRRKSSVSIVLMES
jgi:hypothetical protein